MAQAVAGHNYKILREKGGTEHVIVWQDLSPVLCRVSA